MAALVNSTRSQARQSVKLALQDKSVLQQVPSPQIVPLENTLFWEIRFVKLALLVQSVPRGQHFRLLAMALLMNSILLQIQFNAILALQVKAVLRLQLPQQIAQQVITPNLVIKSVLSVLLAPNALLKQTIQ